MTRKQIEAIWRFADVFDAKDFEFATWQKPEVKDGKLVVSLDNYSLSPPARQFIEALYENGWVVDFDWPSWQDEAITYVRSPDKVASADLETIRKLLTTHVRKDRFCEGHLASMVKNGHVGALLRRLGELCPKTGGCGS